MKMVLCAAVAVIIDIPDDDSAVCAPLANGPLDDLAARLRREACYGHDHSRPDFTLPGVTAWVAAAYQECQDRN
jgi:hypothetical protein